jgi:hypothetical protein
MNLLEATSTLIDVAKTHAHENDHVARRAIKRMEKRLFLLQVRAAKARKRNRFQAFWDAMAVFNGGVCTQKRQAVIPCAACENKMYFGDFCKTAEFTGHGRVKTLACPKCGCLMDRNET